MLQEYCFIMPARRPLKMQVKMPQSHIDLKMHLFERAKLLAEAVRKIDSGVKHPSWIALQEDHNMPESRIRELRSKVKAGGTIEHPLHAYRAKLAHNANAMAYGFKEKHIQIQTKDALQFVTDRFNALKEHFLSEYPEGYEEREMTAEADAYAVIIEEIKKEIEIHDKIYPRSPLFPNN
jgi:hypothetical protein